MSDEGEVGTLSPLRPFEVEAAVEIVRANYGSAIATRARPELLAAFDTIQVSRPSYIAAHRSALLVGFAGFMQSWMDWSVYTLFWVNVAPHAQRQGIGKLLVVEAIRQIRKDSEARLVMLTATQPSYYTPFGFKSLLTFAGDLGTDAQVMCLSIDPRQQPTKGEEDG